MKAQALTRKMDLARRCDGIVAALEGRVGGSPE